MNELNEELLTCWLRLSTSINNARIVSDMTYNESLVCNILYNNSQKNPDNDITATDLCVLTKMLKSQMNRTLNKLEKRNLITKKRSDIDKRLIYITMNKEQSKIYEEQHKRILQILDIIIDNLGKDKTIETISLLTTISSIADNLKLS